MRRQSADRRHDLGFSGLRPIVRQYSGLGAAPFRKERQVDTCDPTIVLVATAMMIVT